MIHEYYGYIEYCLQHSCTQTMYKSVSIIPYTTYLYRCVPNFWQLISCGFCYVCESLSDSYIMLCSFAYDILTSHFFSSLLIDNERFKYVSKELLYFYRVVHQKNLTEPMNSVLYLTKSYFSYPTTLVYDYITWHTLCGEAFVRSFKGSNHTLTMFLGMPSTFSEALAPLTIFLYLPLWGATRKLSKDFQYCE